MEISYREGSQISMIMTEYSSNLLDANNYPILRLFEEIDPNAREDVLMRVTRRREIMF